MSSSSSCVCCPVSLPTRSARAGVALLVQRPEHNSKGRKAPAGHHRGPPAAVRGETTLEFDGAEEGGDAAARAAFLVLAAVILAVALRMLGARPGDPGVQGG